MRITVETTISAPLSQVWRAYTMPGDILRWNAASADWHTTEAEVDLRPGGRFRFRMAAKDGSHAFDFEGIYTEVQPQERLSYDFGDRKAEVDFTETPEGVALRVTFDAETSHSPEQQREGWQAILESFRAHVETGTVGAGGKAVAKNTLCLWFDDQAEEAARFYASVFPDSAVTGAGILCHKAPEPQGGA